MIRYATIGTNSIVDKFMEAASQFPSLVYQTVYSRSEETGQKFRIKHGAVNCCTDLQQLAEDQSVDAVYIASPNSFHFEQAALMLSHGKHVLCEKPITSNEKELQALHAIAAESKVTSSRLPLARPVLLMEAMRSVFAPAFAVIEENLCRLGTIRRVSFQYCQYSSRYDKFKAGIIENAFDPSFSNGALMDIGVYCVHPLVRLFGMPKKIRADGILLSNGVDGAGTIVAAYDGMEAVLAYSKISGGHTPSEIQGEEGTMVITNINQPYDVRLYDRSGKEEILISLPGQCGMEGEVKEWLRLMEGGELGEAHNRNSLLEMRLMDEARRQIGIVFPADVR